jgi:hypothetical protein
MCRDISCAVGRDPITSDDVVMLVYCQTGEKDSIEE